MAYMVTGKVVISGDIVEFYQYEKGYLKDYDKKDGSGGRKKDVVSGNSVENREKVVNRARKSVRRLINANSGTLTKFLTLTFAENEKDLDYCNYEFKKFIERLKYYCKKKDHELQYIVVVEFQKRGAVHYHMLCNLPYIKAKMINEIWGLGSIKINRIDRVDNVGSYVTKYMQKDMSDSRLEGRRSYFKSSNLESSIEILDKKIIESVINSLLEKSCTYSVSFDNEFTGLTQYSQYNLSLIKNQEINTGNTVSVS